MFQAYLQNEKYNKFIYQESVIRFIYLCGTANRVVYKQ